MPNREQLQSLLGRVEAATGPDIELDSLLWAEFDDRDVRYSDNMVLAKSRKAPHDECVLGFIDPGKKRRNFSWYGQFSGAYYGTVDQRVAVTTSIDAALALVERVLPRTYVHSGPLFFIERRRPRWRAYIIRPLWEKWTPDDDWLDKIEADHDNRVLSILAALLSALISESQPKQETQSTEEGT